MNPEYPLGLPERRLPTPVNQRLDALERKVWKLEALCNELTDALVDAAAAIKAISGVSQSKSGEQS